MTIAKRPVALLVVPLLAFARLGNFNRIQVTKIDDYSRFNSEKPIPFRAVLGALKQRLEPWREARGRA
jgi:hypothetical protein